MTELTGVTVKILPLVNTDIMHLLLMSRQEYMLSCGESFQRSLLRTVFLSMHMRMRIKTKGGTGEQACEALWMQVAVR